MTDHQPFFPLKERRRFEGEKFNTPALVQAAPQQVPAVKVLFKTV